MRNYTPEKWKVYYAKAKERITAQRQAREVVSPRPKKKSTYKPKYYLKRREHYLKQSKEWVASHKARASLASRTRRQSARQATIEALGGKCVRCGFSDIRTLQIDHVFGDGYKDKRLRYRHDIQWWKEVMENIDGRYQVLCANCNWIKRHENGEHLVENWKKGHFEKV